MAINASDSYTYEGNYSAAWASIWSLYFPPEIWNEWYQKYGRGFKVLDWLNLSKRTFQIADREFYHFEDGTDLRVATVGATTIATTAAGAQTAAFRLQATDYDTNGNGPLREHFGILIPAEYTNQTTDQWYIIDGKTGVGAAQEYTATPQDVTTSIDVAVPENTELMIGFSTFAPGTGQPTSMTTGTYKRTHNMHLSKETFGLEGGQAAKRNYREVIDRAGNPRLFDRGTVETEFRLDRQMDAAMFSSQGNTNDALLTQDSNFGGTNARLSTKGIWTWASELAQSKAYLGDFDMDDFDDIKPLLQSQGVVDATVMFMYGSNLGLSIENSILDGGVKEWSAGTDLVSGDGFEVNFKRIMKNGIRFALKECVSFSNPNTYGNDSYSYTDCGLIFPVAEAAVTIKGEKRTMPNLAVAYLNHKGEDRTRIVAPVAGPNGLGYPASNEYDGVRMYMLSEFANFMANVNQFVQVTRT